MTWSQAKKGAAGGGAGRSVGWGDGGIDIRDAYAGPELVVIVPTAIARVDRPKGSIRSGTFVPWDRVRGPIRSPAGIAQGSER